MEKYVAMRIDDNMEISTTSTKWLNNNEPHKDWLKGPGVGGCEGKEREGGWDGKER